MDTKISNRTANRQAASLIADCSNAYVRVYSDAVAKPATADTALAGGAVLLAEIRLASTASTGAVNGLITFITTGNAEIVASGNASFFRVVDADGSTVIMDGDIGVSGSGKNMIMNSVALSAGAALGVTGFTHDVRKATAGL